MHLPKTFCSRFTCGCGESFDVAQKILGPYIRVCPGCYKRRARFQAVIDVESFEVLRGAVQRWNVINALAEACKARTYLEIGLGPRGSRSSSHVRIPNRVSVDPFEVDAEQHMTSDQFFAHNRKLFDVVFIDGLHHACQAQRDIENALRVITPGGVVVVHDCNPTTEVAQRVPRPAETPVWNGDVWRAWCRLRRVPDLSMTVVDVDHGCGVITRGAQAPYLGRVDTWAEFQQQRVGALNLVPWPDWRAAQ